MDKRITAAVITAAQDGQRQTGIPACITVAQWALESGYGEHQSGKNNCFGIKAVAGQDCTTRTTQECIKGKWITLPQHFADYPSLSAGFAAHCRLLSAGSPYAAARKLLPDPVAFGRAMSKVYATDPAYWTKLKSIIDANGLLAIDDLSKVAAAAPSSAAPVVVHAEVADAASVLAKAAVSDPKVGPTVAPAPAPSATGLLAHLRSWLAGRPAA